VDKFIVRHFAILAEAALSEQSLFQNPFGHVFRQSPFDMFFLCPVEHLPDGIA
jgi:hypothetical protein